MSLLVGDKLIVQFNYTLTDDEGTVIDSSDGQGPMAYLHGAGNIIPGLEKAMVGKTVGDSFSVSVEPSEAYGEIDPGHVQVVPLEAFQDVDKVEPGMAFHAADPEGNPIQIVVRAVEGDQVTIDGNHPLAGIRLTFAVEIVGIREASAEEIDHGHVH